MCGKTDVFVFILYFLSVNVVYLKSKSTKSIAIHIEIHETHNEAHRIQLKLMPVFEWDRNALDAVPVKTTRLMVKLHQA